VITEILHVTQICQYVTTTRLPSIFHRQIKSLHNTLEEHSRLTNVIERKTHPLLRRTTIRIGRIDVASLDQEPAQLRVPVHGG